MYSNNKYKRTCVIDVVTFLENNESPQNLILIHCDNLLQLYSSPSVIWTV